MFRPALILALGFALSATRLQAAELDDQDRAAIRLAALDYAEGWYAGDRERMARSLHRDLVKRAWLPDGAGGQRYDQLDTQSLLDRNTPSHRDRYAKAPRRADVEILDGFDAVASVKLTMDGWVDYMHLANVPGEGWKIVNVLWALDQRPD